MKKLIDRMRKSGFQTRTAANRWQDVVLLTGGAIGCVTLLATLFMYVRIEDKLLTQLQSVPTEVQTQAYAQALAAKADAFLARRASQHNTVLFRVDAGLEVEASTRARELTFAVVDGQEAGCSIVVEARGDAALAVVTMLPIRLSCPSGSRPIVGEIRYPSGRDVSAQVIATGGGWLKESGLALRLPNAATLQAWIDSP